MKKLSRSKNSIIALVLLVMGVITFSACGKHEININDYLIEDRQTLYTAEDGLYSVTLSTGMREQNYSFDGIINEMVPFAVLTFSRLDSNPLANDSYTYIVDIGEESYTGFLEKTNGENSYSVDLEATAPTDAVVNVRITFTGYSFNEELANISNEFTVDTATAIDIANRELKNELSNITSDKNNKIEAIIKILKDYSNSEIKSYYYYIGILSTSGETLGILIDTTSGDIIAKKV